MLDNIIPIIIGLAVGMALGGAMGYTLYRYLAAKKIKAIEEQAEQLLNDARTRQKEIDLEAQDVALKLREEAEADIKNRRQEVQRQEQRLQARR